MNEQSRVFDFLYEQHKHFTKKNLLSEKINGEWQSYSTFEVIDLVNRLSAGLLELGLSGKDMSVEHQDKIAVISRNRPEWIILDLACQQIGVLLVPIYPTTNAKEIEFIFNDAAVKYVFTSGQELYEKLNGIKENIPSLIDIFCFDILPNAKNWRDIIEDISDVYVSAIEKIKDSILPDQCVTIIYTSGTTGFPKGVMLSHKNLVMNVLNAVKTFPFPVMPEGKALSFLPLNHIFERVATYIYMYTGISIYYAESLDTIGDNLKEVKPVLFTTVPRLLEKVFEKIMLKGSELTGIKKKLFFWAVGLASRYDNLKSGGFFYTLQLSIANKLIFNKWREALGGNVQYLITGGAACQVKLLRIFTAARIPVYEGYGPTENSPVISVNCCKKGGTKFGTVGLVIEGQEVKIEADGEICVKGPSVMMGYYKRPDLTDEVIINGWLHTGDIGVFEDNKYLKITDRKKELFKTSGGKYVAPTAIENKLKESPFIEQVMVIGADQKFVAALIVPSFVNLKEWMKAKNIPFQNNNDAVSNAEVFQFYNNLIAEFNTTFNHVEQVRKFTLISDEWTVENGEMTPKLSLKRKVIMEKYRESILKIYQ